MPRKRPDLSFRLLEIFGALMVHQTMVSTAAKLGISQPSVSAAMKQLEEQLGFVLFEREKKRMRPTIEARLLFDEIEPLFDQMRSIESRARDLRDGSAGKLRLLATPPLGHSVVPVALKQFLQGRPEIKVQYDVRRLEDVIDAVSIGACDVGLCLGLMNHPDVAIQCLRTDTMQALVRSDHPLAKNVHISPADAAQAGFIGLDRRSRLGMKLQTAFEEAQEVYEPQVEVRYCHTAAVLAGAGNGVAIVDSYTAMTQGHNDLVTRPFHPEIPIPASLISRADRPLLSIAAEFAETIKKVFEDFPARFPE